MLVTLPHGQWTIQITATLTAQPSPRRGSSVHIMHLAQGCIAVLRGLAAVMPGLILC